MYKQNFLIIFLVLFVSLFMLKVNAEDRFCTLPSNMTACPDNGIKVKKICSTYSYYDNNGKLITKNVEGYSCCKNGYEISVMADNSYSYDIINTDLCKVCPDNGINVNGLCCKNGFSNRTGKYDYYNPEECKTCPDGGEMIFPYGRPDIPVCVNKETKFAFNKETKKYNQLMPDISGGCPDGSIRKGSWCCKGAYTYDDKTDTWTKYDVICGCPDNGEKVTRHLLIDKHVSECCKNKHKYNPQTKKYDIVDEFFCPTTIEQKIKNDKKEAEFHTTMVVVYGFLLISGIAIRYIIPLIILIIIIVIIIKKIPDITKKE